MNAGPDVERLISGWLHEEAPGRAPDRILEAAGRSIDRTHQRRFFAEWRESMPGMRGLAAAAVIGALVVAGAFYVIRPALGPGDDPSPSITAAPSASAGSPASAAPTRGPLMAGPLKVGIYDGPTLQVADIVTAVNADPTLTPADRTAIIDTFLEIKDKTTWSVSIELRGGQLTERQAVDGNAVIGSLGRYSFPDDSTLVLTETIRGSDVVTQFVLTIDGDSFTLERTSPSRDAADEFVLNVLFESGPFTLR